MHTLDRLPGRYRLLSRPRPDAWGETYVARDLQLHLSVTMRVFHALPDEPTARAAFMARARVATGLRHPNLTEVCDFGVMGRKPFVVTARPSGRALHARYRAAPSLSLGQTIAIASQVASAVAALHQAGLVHGDVTLGRVLLGPGDPSEGVVLQNDGLGLVATSPAFAWEPNGPLGGGEGAGEPASREQDMLRLGQAIAQLVPSEPTGTHVAQDEPERSMPVFRRPSVQAVTQDALPSGFQTLVHAMLAEEPAHRPTAHEVLARLRSLAPDRIGSRR